MANPFTIMGAGMKGKTAGGKEKDGEEEKEVVGKSFINGDLRLETINFKDKEFDEILTKYKVTDPVRNRNWWGCFCWWELFELLFCVVDKANGAGREGKGGIWFLERESVGREESERYEMKVEEMRKVSMGWNEHFAVAGVATGAGKETKQTKLSFGKESSSASASTEDKPKDKDTSK